jgi:hypothetical protein
MQSGYVKLVYIITLCVMIGVHYVTVLLFADCCMQKLLDWKMAEFKISFQAVWSQDGTLQLLDDQPGDLRKELESS